MTAIKTKTHGTLTQSVLDERVVDYGTLAGYARSLGVPSSTVRNWKLRLKREN